MVVLYANYAWKRLVFPSLPTHLLFPHFLHLPSKNIKKKLDKFISLFIAAAGQLREFRL